MLNRENIIKQAIHDCMAEMYAKAQPMADYDNLIEEYNSGKIGKDERIYERHYLSQDEFDYILSKYKEAYRFLDEWNEYLDILLEYLLKGGLKDKYFDDEYDENGELIKPGHRGAEDVLPIKDQINTILNEYNIDNPELCDKLSDAIIEDVKGCKNFYMFDRESGDFSCAIALGASPTSNPESVKKWWKDNYNVDIEIEERNPLLFWEQEYYGDNFEDVMKDEYGENWKEKRDQDWKEYVEERKKLEEEKFKKFQEELNIKNM